MAEQATIHLQVTGDDAAKIFQAVTHAMGQTAGAAKTGSTALQKDMGGAFGDLKGKVAGAAAALSTAVAGVAAYTAAAVAAFKVTQKLVNQWEEQDKINRKLAETIRRTAGAGEDLGLVYDQLQQQASLFSSQTGFGDEEILAAIDKFARVSGQAAVSQNDLAIIYGIAAEKGGDARDAAADYGKALKGDIGFIKDIVKLTPQQEGELNKLKDTTQKTAFVQKLLNEQFGGMPAGVDAAFVSSKNLVNAWGDLQQVAGGVVTQSGLIQLVLDPLTKLLRQMEGIIQDNAKVMKQWILIGLQEAVLTLEKMWPTLQTVAKGATALAGVVQAGVHGWRIFLNVISLINKTLLTFVAVGITGAVTALEGLVKVAAETALKLGSEGLARELAQANASITEFRWKLEGLSKKGFASMKEDVQDIIDGGKGFVESFQEIGDNVETVDKLMESSAKKIRTYASSLADAQKKLAASPNDPIRPTGKGTGGGKQDPVKVPKAAAKAEEDLRQALILRIAAAKATMEVDKIRLTLMAEEAEIAERLRVEVANATTDKEKEIARKKAELELIHARGRAQEGYKALEEKADKVKKKHRRETMKDWREHNELIRQFGDNFADFSTKGSEGLQVFATGMQGLTDVITTTRAAWQKFSEVTERGANTAYAAFQASGQAATVFADAMGASARQQAGILAIFEAASAAAAFASFMYPQGIQHTIAAAMYGSIAAFGGGANAAESSAKSTASSKARSAGASGGTSARRSDATITRDRTREFGGGDQTIIFDQRGSILADTPKAQRIIGDAAMAGQKQRGHDPTRTKRNTVGI